MKKALRSSLDLYLFAKTKGQRAQTAEKKVIKKLSMVLAGRIGLEIKTQQIVNLPPDRNEIACLLNK